MKNKGFTLVELLGVLVIIVVVSLIVTPIVYTNIENVRLQANKRNTDKLIKTALDYYEKNTMKNEKNDELTIECDGSKCFYENNQSEELTFSGAKPKGHITISKYGEVLQADLLFDRYVCSYIDEIIECKKPDLIIDNITDFNTFLSKVDEYDNKTVVLSGDLDYNNKTFTPTSKTFKGEFNALGYSISNINYTGAYHGIFHTIDGATIKSLKVEKSNFEIDESTDNVGVIVGSATNSNIYNCYSIDNVLGAVATNIGGIVGNISSTNVTNCNTARALIIGSVEGNVYVGGVIGTVSSNSNINDCSVIDSYIGGSSSGNRGGIAGSLKGKITNTYVKNIIIHGLNDIGGIAADISGQSDINNCYVLYDESSEKIYSKFESETIFENIDGYIGGIIGSSNNKVNIKNVYVKNLAFNEDNNKSTDGYIIGNTGSNVLVSTDNVYALSPLNVSQSDEFLGGIGSATTSNTIIFNYQGNISYKSSDIKSTLDWKNNLDKNWNTKSGKYPILYKINKNGNPTSYLLGGQE